MTHPKTLCPSCIKLSTFDSDYYGVMCEEFIYIVNKYNDVLQGSFHYLEIDENFHPWWIRARNEVLGFAKEPIQSVKMTILEWRKTML